jgi:flagellar biosynthesis protein FlhF
MSATTKERDAEDILEKFSVCRPDRVIFTKTDETGSVGLILNLLSKREIAISFLTNGQSVPDDIIPATPAELARLLLRV